MSILPDHHDSSNQPTSPDKIKKSPQEYRSKRWHELTAAEEDRKARQAQAEVARAEWSEAVVARSRLRYPGPDVLTGCSQIDPRAGSEVSRLIG